jgi:hypothetical protein
MSENTAVVGGHTLKVVLDRDTVCLSVVCHEVDGTHCRRTCDEGCEDICDDPDKHIKPVDYCVAAEWIALDNNMAECYAGNDELPLHDGMSINLDWTGDCYEWTAVKETVSAE